MAIVTSIIFHGKGSGCSLRFLTRQIITLFYIFVVHGQIYNAQDQYECNDAYNYTNGSKFESNLNTVLNNLVRGASQTGFNISVYGQIPEQIYGLLQCGGDATAQQCYKCSQKAKLKLRQLCVNSVGGRIWLEDCYLRYENGAFFGKLSDDAKYVYSSQNVSGFYSTAEAPANTTQINYSGKASDRIPAIVGGALGSLLFVLVVCLFTCWRRLKSAIFRRQHEGHGQVEKDALFSDRKIIFKMKTLVIATINFHDDNKLGEGGFGPVYKGTTEDGKQIAVKKLSLKSKQGRKEFLNEVKLVAKIQHRNLVNLLGCCAEGSERLLVYEYLPNKSLDRFIFDPNKRADLDWQKRYNIILGIARGLLYLHQDSQLRIVHRDIKASNILLDEKLNPKIADFGLAKLFPEDETQISTGIAGTLGYMAPEYAMQGQLSVKVDVYSFGVVLLELVSGRKNTDHNLSSEMEMLLGWVWSSYKRGNIVQMIDPTIIETCDEEQAARCIHVGLLCTQADSSLRPSMSTVTLMLSAHSVALPDPTKPAYVTVTHNTDSTGSRSGLSHGSPPTSSSVSSFHIPVAHLSIADASITILEPR